MAIRSSSLKQQSRERHSRSTGRTVCSCFSTLAFLNLFIDFTADREIALHLHGLSWRPKFHSMFLNSRFTLTKRMRSAFLVYILLVSSTILLAVLMIATGSCHVLDQISKWMRLTWGKISTYHVSSISHEFCRYRRFVFSPCWCKQVAKWHLQSDIC